MIFEENKKLVFIGDSITDCGRARPIGEGRGEQMGNGYVNLINAHILSKQPALKLRIQNMGIGGNTVRNLKDRWQSDVLDLKPDYLSIKIGINDIWRRYDNPLAVENHVSNEEYESTLNEIIDAVEPSLKGLILMTPYLIDDNPNNKMRIEMDQLGAIVKKTATQRNAIFVDTQAVFDEYMKVNHAFTLAGDQVHPNTAGHMVIARAFLNAVGFEW